MTDDERYMRQALDQAHRAAEMGEVPVGAVIVAGGRTIARAHNLCERLHDFTAHAEMQAFHIGQRIPRGQISWTNARSMSPWNPVPCAQALRFGPGSDGWSTAQKTKNAADSTSLGNGKKAFCIPETEL